MTDETTPDFDDAMVRAQRAIDSMNSAHTRAVVDREGARMRATALEAERDALKAEVARIMADLREARSFILADEERAKLTGDALAAEAERDALEAEVARLRTEVEAYRQMALQADPDQPGEPISNPDELAPADPLPTPAPVTPPVVVPATPTVPVPAHPTAFAVPTSTSGIFVAAMDGDVIPQTRQRDGTFQRGCGYVLDLPSMDTVFRILPDPNATDGPVTGTIRYRANQLTVWPAPGRWSAVGASVGHATPPIYPAATGALTPATLVGADGKPVPPIVDAQGNKWWRVECGAEVPGAFHSEAACGATVFWLRVRAPGVLLESLPAGEYHFPEPIVMGDPTVHGIKFFTDADGRSWQTMKHGFPWPDFMKVSAIPDWKKYLDDSYRQGPLRNGKIKPRGAGHRWEWARIDESWWVLGAAYFVAEMAPDSAWINFLHDYPLDMHGNVPSVGVGLHEDYAVPGRTQVTYYGVRALMATALAVGSTEYHASGSWSSVEMYRIRDMLARCAWEGLLRGRVDYGKWETAYRNSKAMWTTALHEFIGVLAEVMPDYASAQYGSAANWSAFVNLDDDAVFPESAQRTGVFGLIERLDDGSVTWNGGNYDTMPLCLGPTAVYDNVCTPATSMRHDKAWMGWLDGTLSGASRTMWTALRCNPRFPAYRAAVVAKYGRAAVLRAAVNEAGIFGLGVGGGFLGICLTDLDG